MCAMLEYHTISSRRCQSQTEINCKLQPIFQIAHFKGSTSARTVCRQKTTKQLTRFEKRAILASRIQHLSHEMSNVNNIGNYGCKTITFLFLSIRACAIMILPLRHPPPPAALSLPLPLIVSGLF